jgi:uncharacterized ParB-like nuclease family protein
LKSSDEKVPIDILVKRHDGTTYIFAVSMRDAPAKASFEVKGIPDKFALGGARRVSGELRPLHGTEAAFRWPGGG